MKIIQALILLIFSQLVYAAGSLYTVSTNFQFEAEPSVGNELRPKISEAWNLVRQRQFDAAVSEVDSALEEFEKKFNKSEVQLTFQTSDDYKQFSKLHADMKIQRIDWAIREALQIKAYVYSEKNSLIMQ